MVSLVSMPAMLSCLLLCTTACNGESGGNTIGGGRSEPRRTGPGLPFVGPGAKLEICPDQNPQFETVIRIMIPKSLLDPDPSKPWRFVKHHKKSNPANSKPNKSKYAEFQRNPLHVDAESVADENPTDKSKYFKVEVFSENNNLVFFESPLTSAIGIERQIDDQDGKGPDIYANILCQIKDHKPNSAKPKPLLEFFINRQVGKGTSVPVNLMVVGKKDRLGAETPIIIDPKIKNDG